MRLINADALKEAFEMDGYKSPYVERLIDACPTVDPLKHGKWEEGFCSICGAEAAYNDIDEAIFDYDWEENLRYSHTETRREYHKTPFCPDCGAKMDGGKNNG